MDYVVRALRENPELAVFLTLAIGFLIGRVKIGSFSLGTVVGTLLAGVLIGQLNIKVPAIVKTIFFVLFLFTTGYKVGPQFFRGLKRDAIPQVALTVVLCVTCLLTAFAFAKLLGYDIGTAAGLLAGAFSESTVIGTAGDAIQRLAILGRGEDRAAEQHSGRLCRDVPHRDRRRGLVPSHDRAKADGDQPAGRGRAACRPRSRARRSWGSASSRPPDTSISVPTA